VLRGCKKSTKLRFETNFFLENQRADLPRAGVGSFAPFAHFSPIFSLSQKSLKFRHFRHISRENRFPPKPKKRPKIAKHTKHEPLPKRDANFLKFP